MTENEIDLKAKELGLKAPRITPADLDANIADVEYVTHVAKSGQILRWCVITTKSGFAVTGRPGVAASAANDVQKIGESVAYENARNEMWPLMGYHLHQKIAGL